MLAGRFRGKRVVYLKHLEDNTLLVTGPFKVNGVPLRRVNARYVIATSTKVSVEGVNVEKFNVEYFAKEKLTKKEKKEANLFPEQQTKEIKTERVEDQGFVGWNQEDPIVEAIFVRFFLFEERWQATPIEILNWTEKIINDLK